MEPSKLNNCLNNSRDFCECNRVCETCPDSVTHLDTTVYIGVKLKDSQVTYKCPNALKTIDFSSQKYLNIFQKHEIQGSSK